VISFWFLSDLVMMVLTVATGKQGEGIAFGAHVGGTLCGLALMSIQKLFKSPLPVEEVEEDEPPPQRITRGPIRVHLKNAPVHVAELPSIYLFLNEMQTGPFTLAQIQTMFANGTMSSDALYWQEGMIEWQYAEELRPPGTY
jgi:hypothetical protein